MNNYDNFFNNLLPLRHLYPFVQSVLPTVFDDSLSYLETLGKVVKALNDTESNVNTLEQAVRAFADDLAQYENLSITPVEITFNNDTGRYTASMTYADIVSAINEGHTMVLHVVDGLHGAEYYTATMKVTETSNAVKVLYWESPAFTVNDVTVFYETFINENDTVGVTTRTITGSGSDAFIIHYDPVGVTADKTFAEIVAAIEAEKTVMLFADNFFISNARWTTTGNDDIGYEVVSVQFNAFNVVTAPSGKNLGCVTYAVDNTDTWTVTRNGFPNESRVNALIDVKLAQLEGFNNIIILDYVESTGAVTYWDGEQTVNATGQYILNHLIDLASPQLLVLRGVQNHGVGMDTINIYLPVEWGQTTGAWFIDFYRVYDGNVELVRIPYATNIVTKTTTPIGGGTVADAVLYTQQSLTDVQKAQARDNIGADSRPLILNVTESNGVYTVDKTAAEIRANMHNLLLTFGLNEGVTIDSYQIYGSPPKHSIVFSVADPDTTRVTYIEYTVSVYFAEYAPSEAEDVPTVTRRVIHHNVGGGSLPDATDASAGDYLKLDNNKNAVWDELPLFAPPIVDTATGDPASITDGANHYPLKSLIANINPVQSGSGDPSPSNVRPITGWTAIRITKTITGDSGYWDITLPSASGTVYGGTLDVISGLLTVNKAIIDMGDIAWRKSSSQSSDNAAVFFEQISSIGMAARERGEPISMLSDKYAPCPSSIWYIASMTNFHMFNDNTSFFVSDGRYTEVAEFRAAVRGSQLCYELANPLTYQIDPIALYTALGNNGFSADSGAVTVEYYADTKLYIQKIISAANRTTPPTLANKIAETKIDNAAEPEEPEEPEEPKDNE